MATIAERKRKNGTISYLVQIIKRRYGHKESRTFDSRRAAEAWAKKREKEIQEDIYAGRPIVSQKIAQKTPGSGPINFLDAVLSA